MKRYFFISYIALKNNSIQSFCNCSSTTIDSYFNLNQFMEEMKTKLNCDNIIVNNIIELNEKDFNDMYK